MPCIMLLTYIFYILNENEKLNIITLLTFVSKRILIFIAILQLCIFDEKLQLNEYHLIFSYFVLDVIGQNFSRVLPPL